jgi:hypothetical protein
MGAVAGASDIAGALYLPPSLRVVHRIGPGWQAIPMFEQLDPFSVRSQLRQPSVHTRHDKS